MAGFSEGRTKPGGTGSLGTSGSLQFKQGGQFAGDNEITWDPTGDYLSVTGTISASVFYGDGSNLTGIGGGGGTPGGSTTEMQYNNGGAFAGAGGVQFNISRAKGWSTSNGNIAITGSTAGKPQLELGYYDPTFMGSPAAGHLWLIDPMGLVTGSMFMGDGMINQYAGLHLSSSAGVIVNLGDTAGTNKLSIFQHGDNGSAIAEVASIDSLGAFSGSSLTIGGIKPNRQSYSGSVFNSGVITGDTMIAGVNQTASLTLTLPVISTFSGSTLIVKDESGGAATYNIILTASSGVRIDGAGSATISSPYGAITTYHNGTNWFIY